MLEYLRYHGSFYKRFWGVFAGTLALDQLTKMATLLWLPATGEHGATGAVGKPVEVIPGFFNLVHVYNDGAAFSILRGYGWLLVLLALAALVGIFIFRRGLELERVSRQWMFGLLTGGIFGNAVDRMLHGKVVDFLDFNLPLWGRWPAFNVADIGICVGVGIYIVVTFREDRRQTAKVSPAANATIPAPANAPAAPNANADASAVRSVHGATAAATTADDSAPRAKEADNDPAA